MKKLIFLDTETTSADELKRLVQLAYRVEGEEQMVDELFRPPMDISYGAMAVCHITNEMVADKPPFKDHAEKEKLQVLLNDGILVAHNAAFDIEVLEAEGMTVGDQIDTLQVAKHVLKGMEAYNLQYLRYALHLNVDARAHDAAGDITVLEKLFDHLIATLEKEGLSREEAIYKMMEYSNMPTLLESFMFGKYRGRSFEEVSIENRGYLEWLYDSETKKEESDQNTELVFTLKHYLDQPQD